MRLLLVGYCILCSAIARSEPNVAMLYLKLGHQAKEARDYPSARAYFGVACGVAGETRKLGCEAAGLLEAQLQQRLAAVRFLDKACEFGESSSCTMLDEYDRNLTWLQHRSLEARGILFNSPGGTICRPTSQTGWVCDSADPRFKTLFNILFAHTRASGDDPLALEVGRWKGAQRFELNGLPAMEATLHSGDTTAFYTVVLTPSRDLVSVLTVIKNAAIDLYGDVLRDARHSLRPRVSDELDEIVLRGTKFQLAHGQVLKLPFDFDIGPIHLPLAQAASFMRIRTQIHKDRTLLITRGVGPGWLLVHDDKNRVREVLVFR